MSFETLIVLLSLGGFFTAAGLLLIGDAPRGPKGPPPIPCDYCERLGATRHDGPWWAPARVPPVWLCDDCAEPQH